MLVILAFVSMSKPEVNYDVYDDLYKLRPTLRVAARLNQSGITKKIAQAAAREGYDIVLEPGGMRLDMRIERPGQRALDISVGQALSIFKP